MRQHDERRIAGPEPFIGEKCAAVLGLHLQDVEVVVAHVFDPDPLGRSAVDRQQPLGQAVGGQTFEDVATLPVVEVLGVRQLVRKLRGVLVELRHEDHLLRVGHRQRLKEQRVRHRGDRRRRPDTDRERQRRRCREPGAPGQAAHADAQVGPQVVEPRQAALVSQCLHRLGKAAEVRARKPRGLGRRVALPAKPLLRHLEVEAQLALEFPICRVTPERAPQTLQPFAKHSHRDSPRPHAASRVGRRRGQDQRRPTRAVVCH